jgi:Rnl2 family RNA ligase
MAAAGACRGAEMRFTRYDKITNHYDQKFLNYIALEGLSDGLWYAMEKIHGSNGVWAIRLTSDHKYEIKFGSRNMFLDENRTFHNYDKILLQIREKLIFIFQQCMKSADDVVRVYGEIFGGLYEHPDVEKVSGATRVQKGVEYCPDNRFIAFDIMVNDRYVKDAELLHCEPLHVGTLQECLSMNQEFETTIPATLGLPLKENNKAEGLVIKPENGTYLGNGKRAIIKKKSSAFSEVSKSKAKKNPILALSDPALKEVADRLGEYITENRLRNVLSHLGELEPSDFGKVLKTFNADVLEEFESEVGFGDLEKDQKKMLRKILNNTAANMVRFNRIAIFNGEF